jgi:alanine racemase
VEVDLAAISRNARLVHRAAGVRLLPMVKADAYGLGMVAVARALSEMLEPEALHGFGVAAVAEGEALRRSGWGGRIAVLAAPPPGEYARAAAARLELALSSVAEVAAWGEHGTAERPSAFHLEVDTGMGRAGIAADAVDRWLPLLRSTIEGASLDWAGCFTHFHSADEPDLGETDRQYARFHAVREAIEAEKKPIRPAVYHSSNSAAALRRPGYRGDLVRPGIVLYGGHVGADRTPEPVVTVRGRLSLVRELAPGSTVGYGATYRTAGRERIGTVALGYGDGIRRALWPGEGEALVRGHRVPIVGRVSMDMTTLDLTGVPEAAPGDVVTFLGADGEERILVDEVADRCGTISYEILTGLTTRLPRIHLAGDDAPAGDASSS